MPERRGPDTFITPGRAERAPPSGVARLYGCGPGAGVALGAPDHREEVAPVPTVACPGCGEDEDLTGSREGEAIVLTCGVCGHRWDRATRPRCGLCGAHDIEGVPTSTLEEAGRGDQRTPSGIRLVHYCWACGGDDVLSSRPRRGPLPPPGASSDLRGLRAKSRD